jgi:serine protease Do
MKSKIKIIAGLLWIFVFFFIIFLLYTYADKSKEVFENYSSRIKKLLHLNQTEYQGPSGLTNQEVIQEESSVINVVDKVSPAVVSVVVKTVNFDYFSGPSTYQSGIGTGFIVDPTGLIITNSHVVDDPSGEYSVVLKSGETYPVEKIHLDELNDIAILEITARNLPTVALGDSDVLKVGQKAIAIGNALGRFQNTVTVGVISGIARQLQASSVDGNVKTYENAIQTDAALNPGNSGGPLLNSAGQVIGINMATTYGAENISFAIPVNNLKPVLEGFIKEGKIVRPYLGVTYRMITKEIATLRELPEGAFIASVLPGSPAEKAQLKRGDIVTRIGGKDMNSTLSLSQVIAKIKVGDKLDLEIDREGKKISITAVLEAAPEKN